MAHLKITNNTGKDIIITKVSGKKAEKKIIHIKEYEEVCVPIHSDFYTDPKVTENLTIIKNEYKLN